MTNVYIFVDPFNEATSGVSTYVDSARKLAKKINADFKIISRQNGEEIDYFRRRVALFSKNHHQKNVWIESPETLHSTKYVDTSQVNLHVRLHGSRQFGAWLQKNNINLEEVKAEEREVDRAHFVSAPSVAAGLSSWLLYASKKNIYFYPNPAPLLIDSNHKQEPPMVDVLFLGRWQRLKGISFFVEIIRRSCELTFAVASAEAPRDLPKGIEFFPTFDEKSRISAIRRSKVVLISSLFETASMVGLEAIQLNRRIVCWRHLGLVEYFGEDLVYSAKAGDLEDLIGQLKHAVKNFNFDSCFKESVDQINNNFVQGIGLLIAKQPIANLMPFPLRSNNFVADLNLIRELGVVKDKKLIFKRKVKKLLRDPRHFFRDSKFFSLLYSKHGSDKTAPLSQVNVVAHEEIGLLVGNRAPILEVHADSIDEFLIAEIDGQSRVTVSAIPGSPSGWRTVIVYCRGDEERLKNLRSKLTAFEDFSPFKAEYLKHICLELNRDYSVLSILNRIDVANKEKISSISNLIFLDPPLNGVVALRSCGPYVRTIVVRTEKSKDIQLADVSSIDALVSNIDSDFSITSIGRVNRFNKFEDCAEVLRKIVQEVGPKNPDMLLPLIGCQQYSEEYIDFDPRNYQGIIFIRSYESTSVSSFENYIEALSPNVRGMMVVESVYMKYRGLCEMVEAGNGPADLIKACLFDGVLFDVREEN